MPVLPESVVPMLATLGELPADEDGWAFEVKWDGFRALAYVEDGTCRLQSRNLLPLDQRFPSVVEHLPAALRDRAVLLDGEIVALDERGRPDFQRLQNHRSGQPLAFVVFDVLHVDGAWVTDEPWERRREVLEGLGIDGPCWQVPAPHPDGRLLLDASRDLGLEGIVAKRRGSRYLPGRRSKDWLKIKNVRRQEVVVGGWLGGEGRRSGTLGALLIGVREEPGGPLLFAGKVGTGFTDAELDRLQRALAPLAADASPFATKVPYRRANFVRPELIAEIAFTEWTRDGTLRHPSYKGLRDDKDPADVVREER